MFLLTHWKSNRRITTEIDLFFFSILKSVTICLLSFGKLISMVSWREIVLLVTLSYCDPLPGLPVCRSRRSLSPRTHGKIIKWHDETPTKTTILFLPKETRLMETRPQWKLRTGKTQSWIMLGSSQPASLQVHRPIPSPAPTFCHAAGTLGCLLF